MMKRISQSITNVAKYNKFQILIISLITLCLITASAALLINPISAQESDNKKNKKNEFVNRVAAILNIEPSNLSEAMEKVKMEIGEETKQRKLSEAKINITKKVQSGVITQEKAEEFYNNLENKMNSKEGNKPQKKMGKPSKKFQYSPKSLKFKSQLGNKLKEGSIDKEQASKMWKNHMGKFNKSKKPISSETLKQNLDKKVESGSLSQEKADALYENFLSRTTKKK